MVDTQGLAVGLAIGIPSLIAVVVCVYLWLRNQRKQKEEYEQENAIDVEMGDNESFSQFQDQLHKPYDPKLPHTANDEFVEVDGKHSDPDQLSLSHTKTETIASHPVRTPRPARHKKTGSSYDFYETVIPTFGESPLHQDLLAFGAPPVISQDAASANSSNTSIVGTTTPTADKSLDNLAKQLMAPTFFEKLPSRAATVNLKHRPNAQLPNNLSTDLTKNELVETGGINDNYVYEAPEIEESHPYRDIGSKNNLNTILGDNIDSNFDREQDSPFEEPVVFK